MLLKNKNVIGVQVFLELGITNQIVGKLFEEGGLFHFEYQSEYLRALKAIPLGPEMPLTKRKYHAEKLFQPFLERIPSRENPAYPEYCKSVGISVQEENPFILLSTIASRGPSSFLFKPIYSEDFTGSALKRFRQHLGLTVREFAHAFDFSPPGITRVETGKSDGREILKRAEIYASYPDVALDQLKKQAGFIHWKKLNHAREWLQKQRGLTRG